MFVDELVIASSNASKVRELRLHLQELAPNIMVSSLFDFSLTCQECGDVGGGLSERAESRALRMAVLLKKPCISDQSALFVPVLGDDQWMGTCEEDGSSLSHVTLISQLLQALAHVDDEGRAAFLETALALALPGRGVVFSASARMEGYIAEEAKGSSSRDFSSVFIKYSYGKTLAQLPEPVVFRISQRRKVCERLTYFISSLTN